MISLRSTRSRATVAVAAFVVLWLGCWALCYLFSHNIEFLWVPAATLVGVALWGLVVAVVYEWIYQESDSDRHAETRRQERDARREADRQADRIGESVARSLRGVDIKLDSRGVARLVRDGEKRNRHGG